MRKLVQPMSKLAVDGLRVATDTSFKLQCVNNLALGRVINIDTAGVFISSKFVMITFLLLKHLHIRVDEIR
jgi:hypothetical protein